MNRSDALKLCNGALKELEEQLKAGRSESFERFVAAAARFHDYSFRNVMMILSQRPEATRVAGLRTWNRLNRYVRKGEKGIAIFAPMVFKAKDGDESRLVDEGPRINFRVAHVFDVGQTDGEPLPEPSVVTGDPASYLGRLRDAVAQSGIVLEYHDDLGPALGKSCGGTVKIESGLAPAHEFSVLAHEFAHELLHQGEAKGNASKGQRELEAEAVAFVVCKFAGLESNSAHSDYIQRFSGSPDALAASLEFVQRTASRIIEAIAGREEKLAA